MGPEASQLRQVVGGALAGVVAVLAMAACLLAPASASAFVGESTVLNAPKTDLTGPAKTILTKPTFLPGTVGQAAAAGGATEAGGAAGIFSASGVLPVLGAVAAFGVGTVIGSEICDVLGIEGCWYFGSEGADPTLDATGLGEGTWRVPNESQLETIPGGYWYWDPAWASGTGWRARTWGQADECEWPGIETASSYLPVYEPTGCAGSPEAPKTTIPLRSYMANRVLNYHASDDPEIGNYSHSAPENWSEKLAAELAGEEDTPAARVGEKIASEIEGSGVSNPYAVTVTVPECSGEAWIGCKEQLEELELVPERDTLSWEDAVLDLDADQVVELQPEPATEVETGSKVVVTTNPGEEGMPLVIPVPESGETYDEYAARLAPGLKPERVNVCEACIDPSTGPNGVVGVAPDPGTRLDPGIEHEVDVSTNPATAPQPAGGWSPPNIPTIDMTPLTGLGTPCSVFPFGLLCWLGEGITQFNSPGECPETSIDIPSPGGGEDGEFTLGLCVEPAEQALTIIRPIILFLWVIGCGFLFARATKAIGGD